VVDNMKAPILIIHIHLKVSKTDPIQLWCHSSKGWRPQHSQGSINTACHFKTREMAYPTPSRGL